MTWAGARPGRVRASTRELYRTVAVVAAGMWEAARARIQAAEATGPVKGPMEPEMSQAMPTLSGGAGTRRLVVRVKGSAVGTAPAARWARAATAWLMRSRPGGSWEVVVVVARVPAVASRRARARRRAAAASSSRGSRVPAWWRRAGPSLPKTLSDALPARLRAAFSAARWAALPGGKAGGGARSAATSAAISRMASAMASASSEGISMMTGAGGGVSGSMPRMRHQRRASLVRVRASSSAILRNSRQVARRRSRRVGAGDGLDLGLDQGGLAGVEDPGVAPGEYQGGGGAGLAGGRGGGPGLGEVVQDELGDGGAQPAAVAGAAGDLAALGPGLFQLVGGLAPGGALGRGLAGQGVGGVRALVGEGSPEGGVAGPVRGKAGAGGGRRYPEEVAVDLDDREPGDGLAGDGGDVAGGRAEPGSGGAGDRDGVAGDRGCLGGEGVRQCLPVARGGGEQARGDGGGGGGGAGAAVADMAGQVLSGRGGRGQSWRPRARGATPRGRLKALARAAATTSRSSSGPIPARLAMAAFSPRMPATLA